MTGWQRYWLVIPCAAVVYCTGFAITGDPVAGLFVAVAIGVICAAVALPLIAWVRVTDLEHKYQRLCQYTDDRVEEVEARTAAVEKRVGMNRFGLPDQRKKIG
jgi:hypothetical protein